VAPRLLLRSRMSRIYPSLSGGESLTAAILFLVLAVLLVVLFMFAS
jgi:hypothetical protein